MRNTSTVIAVVLSTASLAYAGSPGLMQRYRERQSAIGDAAKLGGTPATLLGRDRARLDAIAKALDGGAAARARLSDDTLRYFARRTEQAIESLSARRVAKERKVQRAIGGMQGMGRITRLSRTLDALSAELKVQRAREERVKALLQAPR